MSKPDNTGKPDAELGAKAEAPTASSSSSSKPGVATSRAEVSTMEKLRNALLIGGSIGFFYALFHSLNISLARGFWWFVIGSAVILIFVRLRSRAK